MIPVNPIPLGLRVVLPDGTKGWVIAGSCDKPILGVMDDNGRTTAVNAEELRREDD